MTTLAIFTALLINFQGLEPRNAGGVCKQFNNFMDQEWAEKHSYDAIWDACHKDKECRKATKGIDLDLLCDLE